MKTPAAQSLKYAEVVKTEEVSGIVYANVANESRREIKIRINSETRRKKPNFAQRNSLIDKVMLNWTNFEAIFCFILDKNAKLSNFLPIERSEIGQTDTKLSFAKRNSYKMAENESSVDYDYSCRYC